MVAAFAFGGTLLPFLALVIAFGASEVDGGKNGKKEARREGIGGPGGFLGNEA